jgi:peptidyl-prolyl cis-trans isomerase SurA
MFKPYKLIISCLTLLIATVGYSQPKTIQVVDEVIAVVGNTPILRSELDILVTQLDPEITPTSEVRCDLLQRLLINKMLVHQALIDSIPLTDAEVEDRIDNNLRIFERQMNNKANLEKYLGMTTDEYKKQIFHKLKAQMLFFYLLQLVYLNGLLLQLEYSFLGCIGFVLMDYHQ